MNFRNMLGIVLAAVVLFVLIQLIPYGHNHTNPPVSQEVQWDSPQTRDLAVRACYDCHSNQTVWPWYSNVAPVSWLIQHDVEEGRQYLNFSEWDKPQPKADRAADQVQRGEMPKSNYLPLHPSANLTPAEKDMLIQGLRATVGQK
ncbi:MAG: heme-binding domain-containing protein [Chloroflexota bacterium]